MNLRSGLHWETAPIRNITEHLGAENPTTKAPFTESELIGFGGGLSGGYFCFNMCDCIYVHTGFRDRWHTYKGNFSTDACTRIGVQTEVWEGGSKKKAHEALLEEVAAGRPSWVTAAAAAHPHLGHHPDYLKSLVYGFGVWNHTDDGWDCDDKGRQIIIPDEEITLSRSAMPATKNLFLKFTGLTKIDFKSYTKEAIHACVDNLFNPPIKNFGLSGLEKWADQMIDERDIKAWQKLLTDNRQVTEALANSYAYALGEHGETALRAEYAEFLDMAAKTLDNSALTPVANQYRAVGREWNALLQSLLPQTDQGQALKNQIENVVQLIRSDHTPEEARTARQKQTDLMQDPAVFQGIERQSHLETLNQEIKRLVTKEAEYRRVLESRRNLTVQPIPRPPLSKLLAHHKL